ncbi:outer membrane protein assembly factor BamE, partial [Amylibacter sp.]|nr:outer membrane protein assembly factor BamE [Amylibacter sp.]
MSKFAFKYQTIIFSTFLLASCSTIYKDHGYLPLDTDLKSVVVGKDTRNSVTELLGSPLGSGVLEDGAIFYISTKIKNFLFYEPKVVSRDMIVVSFDEKNLVENIEKFTLEDGRVVVLSRRVTSAPVKG